MPSPTRSLHLSLIQKLASSDSSSSCRHSCSAVADLLRTSDQCLLQISPIHICLAGLALLESDGADEVQQEQEQQLHQITPTFPMFQTFQEYCRHYNDHNAPATPVSLLPALSPRVMPNTEQLTAIRQLVARFALESLEEDLLREKTTTDDARENHVHDVKPKSQKAKRHKKVKVRQESKSRTRGRPSSVYPDDSSDEKISLVDLVQTSLRSAQVENANDDVSVITEDVWIPIPPKMTVKRRLPAVHGAEVEPNVWVEPNYQSNRALEFMKDRSTYVESPGLDESPSVATNRNQPPILDAASIKTLVTTSIALNANALLSEGSSDQRIAHDVPKTNHHHFSTENQDTVPNVAKSDRSLISNEFNTEIPPNCIIPRQTNNDRMAELEEALKNTKNLLRQERSRHAQQLNQEKEQHANSMQALQLRLYISETRVKTYQDALDKHLQSVASNAWHT